MLFYFLTILALFFLSKTKKQKTLYKCGGDILDLFAQVEVDPKPINYNNPLNKRRLKDIDGDGFKNFNLYVDLTNIKKDIELYKLQNYSDIFINSINKAKETLIDLLKVKAKKLILILKIMISNILRLIIGIKKNLELMLKIRV